MAPASTARRMSPSGRVVTRGDPAGGLDAVEAGHAQVHEDDVGGELGSQGDGLGAVGCLAHHLEVRLAGEHADDPGAHHRVVVDHQKADPAGVRAGWWTRKRAGRTRGARGAR